jgi:polysaccharide pyruvyl transferase WcaK-like protein
MEAEGLANEPRPIFAICPHFFSNIDNYRVHHYEQFSDDAIARQREVLAAAADYLSAFGRVILLPMNCDNPDNDLLVQREIRVRMKSPNAVTVVEQQYKPAEIAGIYSRCKLVLGVRLHALIMAAAVKCPVVAINYAPKVEGFMQLLGRPQDMIRLQDVSTDQLLALLSDYLQNYTTRRSQFEQCVEKLQARAAWNADMATAIITGTSPPPMLSEAL